MVAVIQTWPRRVSSTNSLRGGLPSDGCSDLFRYPSDSVSSVFSFECPAYFNEPAMALLTRMSDTSKGRVFRGICGRILVRSQRRGAPSGSDSRKTGGSSTAGNTGKQGISPAFAVQVTHEFCGGGQFLMVVIELRYNSDARQSTPRRAQNGATRRGTVRKH